VDCFAYIYMFASGFTFYRLRLGRFLTVFPFRFITLGSRRVSSSDTLSYFYTPHTSKSRLPILFIHGIGVGMWPYTGFLRALHRADAQAADGQTGIIALEIMPLSSRITGTMPSHQQLGADILRILDHHGWDRVELISHSYGSVITANMLRQPVVSARIGPMLMIDPVTFLLHLPDIAYNFTRRLPRQANECELYYFASTDMLIAETLARRFFWAENILWKEDLRGRSVTVVLGGKDIVAPTLAIGRYLTADEPGYERFLTEEDDDHGADRGQADYAWQERPWRSEGVDVVWFAHCDHAEVFEFRKDYGRLVDIARSYSAHGE
jgi:pimeloyl-ACP methyl ester carboxylesterase